MKLDPSREEREARHYILGYLLDNPDAGDTFDGIAEWWLLSQRIKFETRTVFEAVARLVADGLIVEQRGPDSRIVYKVNRTGADSQNVLSRIRASWLTE